MTAQGKGLAKAVLGLMMFAAGFYTERGDSFGRHFTPRPLQCAERGNYKGTEEIPKDRENSA